MIIERNGYFYIPIGAFAKKAGIKDRSVIDYYINNGFIHSSYYFVEDIDGTGVFRYFIREDKAKDLRYFLDHYVRIDAYRNEIFRKYGINISFGEIWNMITLGFVSPNWIKQIEFHNRKGSRSTVIFYGINYIEKFVEAIEEYRRTKGQRNGYACFDLDYSDPPPDAILYKPNENCEGFLLTPEQIERLKIIRQYKEGIIPLF